MEAFNTVIRNLIFDNPEEFQIGDFLMAYDTTQYIGDKITFKIDNSDDFRVMITNKTTKKFCGIDFQG